MLYQKLKRNVQCLLCPHNCLIHEGKFGLCGVRQNVGGKVRSKNYGWVSGIHVDPIEKKPLYHYFPGQKILSVGSFGCNLKCNFCQNWQISQDCEANNLRGKEMSVAEILKIAKATPDNLGVAYTYNEPTVWYEYMLEIAREISAAGLKNIVVTNGYINQEPLLNLLPSVDAFNVDLKGFSESFYREMTGASLEPVLETLKTIRAFNRHLEITNLIIPRKNDDLDKFQEMILWIAKELGEKTVLHLSRYFPRYKQSEKATEVNLLMELWNLAKKHLNYVYLGNVETAIYSNTYCSTCGALLIERRGYKTEIAEELTDGKCAKCHAEAHIIMT